MLGRSYRIIETDEKKEKRLEGGRTGLTDGSVHTIYLAPVLPGDEKDLVEDVNRFNRTVLCHEIVHAFRIESTADCLDLDEEGNVEWFGQMLPRIVRACHEAGALTDEDIEA